MTSSTSSGAKPILASVVSGCSTPSYFLPLGDQPPFIPVSTRASRFLPPDGPPWRAV